MARARIDLVSRSKPRKTRGGKGWRKLPVETFVKAFFASAAIFGGLAALLWLLGVIDFTAERGFRKPTACGFLYLFVPDSLQRPGLCVAFNLLPFAFIPVVILVFLIRRIFAEARA